MFRQIAPFEIWSKPPKICCLTRALRHVNFIICVYHVFAVCKSDSTIYIIVVGCRDTGLSWPFLLHIIGQLDERIVAWYYFVSPGRKRKLEGFEMHASATMIMGVIFCDAYTRGLFKFRRLISS